MTELTPELAKAVDLLQVDKFKEWLDQYPDKTLGEIIEVNNLNSKTLCPLAVYLRCHQTPEERKLNLGIGTVIHLTGNPTGDFYFHMDLPYWAGSFARRADAASAESKDWNKLTTEKMQRMLFDITSLEKL